jgi:hypothetical protein
LGAFTYPRSEPGSGGHQDLVEKLNAFRIRLRSEIEGVTEEALSHRPGDGEWSIKEIAGHLCDHAAHLHRRLYRISKQEEPRLPAWDEHDALVARDAQSKPIDSLVEEFVSQRGETVELLADLVHWNWARTGRHEQLGRISIRQLVDRAVAHDENHLAQIRALKDAAKAGV